MQEIYIPAQYHHHHLEKSFLCNATVFAFPYFQYPLLNRNRKGDRAMANKEEKTKKWRMKTKHKAGSRQLGHNLARIELSMESERCKKYYTKHLWWPLGPQELNPKQTRCVVPLGNLHPSKLYRLQELNEIVVDKRFIT